MLDALSGGGRISCLNAVIALLSVHPFFGAHQDKRLEDVVRCNASFTPQQDDQLVRWTFSLAASRSKDAVDLQPSELVLDARAEMTYSFLKDVPVEDLRTRFATLKVFNMQLARCMDMVDMANTEQRWSLAYHIRCLGHVIFASTKQRLVDMAIELTWTPVGSFGVTILFDNQLAFQSMEQNLKDPSNSHCMFMQAFSKIGNNRGSQYRARVR
jgi:hypothetical protein